MGHERAHGVGRVLRGDDLRHYTPGDDLPDFQGAA